MKTTINPASISLELDGVTHILSLDKAKQVIDILKQEVRTLESHLQTAAPVMNDRIFKQIEENWRKKNPYPSFPPVQPYFEPDKNGSFPKIWCSSKQQGAYIYGKYY